MSRVQGKLELDGIDCSFFQKVPNRGCTYVCKAGCLQNSYHYTRMTHNEMLTQTMTLTTPEQPEWQCYHLLLPQGEWGYSRCSLSLRVAPIPPQKWTAAYTVRQHLKCTQHLAALHTGKKSWSSSLPCSFHIQTSSPAKASSLLDAPKLPPAQVLHLVWFLGKRLQINLQYWLKTTVWKTGTLLYPAI